MEASNHTSLGVSVLQRLWPTNHWHVPHHLIKDSSTVETLISLTSRMAASENIRWPSYLSDWSTLPGTHFQSTRESFTCNAGIEPGGFSILPVGYSWGRAFSNANSCAEEWTSVDATILSPTQWNEAAKRHKFYSTVEGTLSDHPSYDRSPAKVSILLDNVPHEGETLCSLHLILPQRGSPSGLSQLLGSCSETFSISAFKAVIS